MWRWAAELRVEKKELGCAVLCWAEAPPKEEKPGGECAAGQQRGSAPASRLQRTGETPNFPIALDWRAFTVGHQRRAQNGITSVQGESFKARIEWCRAALRCECWPGGESFLRRLGSAAGDEGAITGVLGCFPWGYGASRTRVCGQLLTGGPEVDQLVDLCRLRRTRGPLHYRYRCQLRPNSVSHPSTRTRTHTHTQMIQDDYVLQQPKTIRSQ